MPRIAIDSEISFPAFPDWVTPTLPVPTIPKVNFLPQQIAGLIPFFECDSPDCRELCEQCKYKNPVFGEILQRSFQKNKTYENDWNSFWLNASLGRGININIVFQLEKVVNGAWVHQTDLNTNQYGLFFPKGFFPSHPTYIGYELNWGAVVFYLGEGCYRVKAKIFAITTQLSQSLTGGSQANCTFNLAGVTCAAGKLLGGLKTISGNIPATYSFNQTNSSFTIADNIDYIVNLINTGIYPYTAVRTGDTFTITGQNFASNNGVAWNISIFKPQTFGSPGCEYIKTETMRNGEDPAYESFEVETLAGCLETPCFHLKIWDCIRAHGTVKLETEMTGKIGDPYKDYLKHNMCPKMFYDSLRFPGFFGKQQGKYKTDNLEWGEPKHGLIEHVRDELTQSWELTTDYVPEYIATRLSAFGMMSDKKLISDYNINNSDYTIKRKHVIRVSDFEVEYLDDRAAWERRHKQKIKMKFERGVQSVEKSLCC